MPTVQHHTTHCNKKEEKETITQETNTLIQRIITLIKKKKLLAVLLASLLTGAGTWVGSATLGWLSYKASEISTALKGYQNIQSKYQGLENRVNSLEYYRISDSINNEHESQMMRNRFNNYQRRSRNNNGQ